MLTLFSIPKPWKGHISVIQQNAVQSWTLLRPACEIILFGDDQGTEEMAKYFKVRHFPQVARNEYNTPLVSDIFLKAQRLAKYDILCYLNSDIILMSNFLPAVRSIVGSKYRFLVVGQRWNFEQKELINFNNPEWEYLLKQKVYKYGHLNPKTGIDYLVFKRGLYKNIPSFAVGRPAWDNWMLFYTRLQKIPLINATAEITVVHQNHEIKYPTEYEGPEHKRNLELAGGYCHVFTIQDATHVLTKKGVRWSLSKEHLHRHCQTLPYLFPRTRPIIFFLRYIYRLFHMNLIKK